MVQTTERPIQSELITEVGISSIQPNPYQPTSRLEIDEETTKKFAGSILRHGVIQKPVCRPAAGGGYEMGDGWLRLAGCRHLANDGHPEFSKISVIVRELTDRQMADLVMEANMVRQDLNPIEEAQLYKRYIEDFGTSQGDLAKEHNCSQGKIANTIRLLELPDDIQGKIISQEITEAHGRQFLRLNKAPELQAKAVKDCINRNTPVSNLSNEIESNLWYNSKCLNPKSELHWHRPLFDISECKDCGRRIKASHPHESRKKEDRCLDETCWEEKNSAAVQAQVDEAKKSSGKKGDKVKILTRDQVSYGQYEDITPKNIDNPAECKGCKKAALFKYEISSPGKPDNICLDPACYRKKKTKKTRDTNKLLKQKDQELTEELGKFFNGVATPLNFVQISRCLHVIARHVIPMLSADSNRDLCKSFDVPTLANGRLDRDALLVSLGTKDTKQLIQLTVAAVMIRARRGDYTASGFNTKLTQDLKRDQKIILGKLDEHIAEITAFQEKNCRGCGHVNEAKIGTGEECCGFTYYKKLNDKGDCTGRSVKEA